MNSMFRRALVGFVLLGIAAGGVYSWRFLQGRDANAVARVKAHGQSAQPVIASPVLEKAMPVRLAAIGTVQPVHTVAVRTRLDSQITQVLVQDGQHVAAGQPLFVLDTRQLEAQRHQAEAVLARDEAQLAFARRQLARKKPQISSAQQIDEARTNLASLQASVRADRANLESLSVQQSYGRIVAPIAGRIGTVLSKAGSLVRSTDPQPLLTINQLRPVYVSFSVPQSALARIQQALAAGSVPTQASVPGNDAITEQGHVAFLENAVDSSTSTISVKGLFPNAHERLWPGAYVNVVVTLRTDAHALVVPSRAVQVGQDGSYVFVLTKDNTVASRPVTVDRMIGEESVIAQGVKRGMRVVVEGQLRLVDGAPVEVRNAKPKASQ